jgi:hypothetical protein
MKRAEIVRAIKPYLREAIRSIDEHGVPKGRNSTSYSFRHEGRLYPPKYLVAQAFRLATSQTLSPDDHHGGEQDSNKVLRELVSEGAIQGGIVAQPSDRPPSGQPPALKPASAAEEQRARKRIEADIWQRRGQPKFRENLLDAYGRRCAITDCDAVPTLEAAHIRTYKGSDVNHITNGILLRADIHTLFDLGLICVRTTSCKVGICKELKGTCYESLDGKCVRLPANAKLWHKALDYHRRKIFSP